MIYIGNFGFVERSRDLHAFLMYSDSGNDWIWPDLSKYTQSCQFAQAKKLLLLAYLEFHFVPGIREVIVSYEPFPVAPILCFQTWALFESYTMFSDRQLMSKLAGLALRCTILYLDANKFNDRGLVYFNKGKEKHKHEETLMVFTRKDVTSK